MNSNQNDLVVNEILDGDDTTAELDLIILAAGFEDRSFNIIDSSVFAKNAHCLLIKYDRDVESDDDLYLKYLTVVEKKFSKNRIHQLHIDTAEVQNFSQSISLFMRDLSPEVKRIGLDASGMTSYLICLILKYAREVRPFQQQRVFYSSAKNYVPSKSDYLKLVDSWQERELTFLPNSMALEMSENLVLEEFSGHASGDGLKCLAVFVGYEVHRTSGTIEAINPSQLLIIYGVPGNEKISWRLDFSRKLHAKFERERSCATEQVSTLNVQESLQLLESYYNYLIDDYDLVIAPVCSKMQVVSTYLFWERYGEVQLTFPLPIGYNKDLRPKGVGNSYYVDLYEQRMLFRQSGQVLDSE